MAQESKHNEETLSEDVAQNAGARTAQTNHDPSITEEETRNAAAGETPNASGSTAPSTVEENIPSRSDPEAVKIPTSYDPEP